MADNLLIINKNYDFFSLKLKRNHVLTRLLPDLYVTFSDPLFFGASSARLYWRESPQMAAINK